MRIVNLIHHAYDISGGYSEYEVYTENQDAEIITDIFREETCNLLNEDEQNAKVNEITGCCVIWIKEVYEYWFTCDRAPANIFADYFTYNHTLTKKDIK